MRSIDIICPVYAEGQGIVLFHDRVAKVMADFEGRYAFRVIYVVDPAKDDTEQTIEVLAARDPRVDMIVMSRRFGHQMALVAGIDVSTADAAVMLDSDLQHPPELIAEFIAEWENGGEVIQAVRIDGAETPGWKRATSSWFYKTFMTVGSTPLRAGAADFRLLSRRVVEVFQTEVREHNPFLRGLVSWVGFNVRYVEFQNEARVSGATKYKLSTLIEFAINGVTSFSKMPLRVCIGLGSAAAILSIIYGLWNIVAALIDERTVPGWPTLITVVTFLGGIQLIFLGVLGEYLSVIFDEVKDRPRYLVSRHLRSSKRKEHSLRGANRSDDVLRDLSEGEEIERA